MKNLLIVIVLVLVAATGFSQRKQANKRKTKLKAAFARQATIINKRKGATTGSIGKLP